MDSTAFLHLVRATETPRGTAALWWLGQMGLWVKLGGTVLSIDYYASRDAERLVPPPVPAEEVRGVDAFLGTHDHLDHIDHESWRIWAHNCPEAVFVFPRLHAAAITADGIAPERQRGLWDGGACRVGEVTIRAVAAAHEFLAPDPATGLHPALQYVIEGNGVRMWHAGDTVRYEGMLPKLQALGPLDAALVPINGRDAVRYRRNCIGNMTFQEAADLVGELRPGLAIPGHWDLFPGNTANPADFTAYLSAKYPQQRWKVPGYGETVWVETPANPDGAKDAG